MATATLAKSPTGTKADDLSELKELVKRDRNHPSVIAWSLYNEEGLQGTDEGAAIFHKMRAVVDELDGTRLSTGANNFGYDKGIVNGDRPVRVQLQRRRLRGRPRERDPKSPLYGSETASAVSTRGEYANDPVKGYVSAYDVNKPGWGNTAEEAWKAVATSLGWRARSSGRASTTRASRPPTAGPASTRHFGILDIAGFPKDTFWYYQAWWGTEPVVHLLPHWNWPRARAPSRSGRTRTRTEVELFLNGKSLGAKDVPQLGHVEWDVPYAPGTLEARGYRGRQDRSRRDRVETTGAPAALRLTTDRTNDSSPTTRT